MGEAIVRKKQNKFASPLFLLDGLALVAIRITDLNIEAMNELIQIAFSPVNLVYTFLLILVVMYWMLIIIGAISFEAFDVDFDLDADVDLDMDVDMDSGGAGNFAGALHFFNFGKLPFMVIISFLILFSWAISVLVNYYAGDGSILFALALVFPNLFVGLCLTKVITTPLVPVFEKMEAGIEAVDYVGMTCKLVLPPSISQMGQAEVLIDNSPLLVNVKVESESIGEFEKGAEAVILRKEKNKPYYIISSL